MLIFWTGFGWIVPVCTFLALLVTERLVEAVSGSDTFYQAHAWPPLVGVALSGTAIWLLSRFLDSRRAPESRRSAHTFMFAPLRYWSSLVPLIGVIEHFTR